MGSLRPETYGWFWQLAGGLAPRNPVPADLKKDVLNKYLPVLRQYGMDSAADYLGQWVQGTLHLEPLADVSACHGSFNI